MRKVILGFFNAKTREQVDEARAREVYNAYYSEVRRLVPPERRLEYKIGSGWEPLCTFLGVEEPSVPFPQANDRVVHSKETKSRHITLIVNAMKTTGPWVIGAVVAWGAWLYYQGKPPF
jgi:hypothetical protein